MSALPNTVAEAAQQLRAGELTSIELVESAIAAADRLDGRLGTYLTRLDDSARRAAERADRELAAGLDRGPLHGIPLGIKDLIAVAGAPTTAQSLVQDRAWGAGRDAPAVARLRAAGAVFTGKTTTMEFGCGVPTQSLPLPRNPYDLDTWSGGSSSGTANGIAAGLFLAGLGSDTAGSIRMPAAFCGVTGLMPTFGRVPKSGCLPLSYSLDRVGPLARTARDCAEVLAVVAGAHPSDSGSAPEPLPQFTFDDALTGLRIGVVHSGHFPAEADPALTPSFAAAIDILTGLGASVHEVELPYFRELAAATIITATSEGLATHQRTLTTRWNDYGVASRGLLAGGALASGADYVQAQRVRRVAAHAVRALFDTVDVIVCPTAAVGAPTFDLVATAAGHQDHAGLFAQVFTPYWNSLANPVLALPMGQTATGLPLSMQLAGPAFGEAVVLRTGAAFQHHTAWHLRRPEVTA